MVHHRISSSTRFSTAFKLDAGLCLDIYIYVSYVPLFIKENIENKLNDIYDTQVKLSSGGYLVINPTEALVSIDVNSGRSIKQKNVESTALDTNLEAAEEIARQIKIRDLSGLIIIDFIDMMSFGNRRQVERRLKERCRKDRARIQIGRISSFGLLEMSRQRLRESSVQWNISLTNESFAQKVMKTVEINAIKNKSKLVQIIVPEKIKNFLSDNFKEDILYIEKKNKIKLTFVGDLSLLVPEYKIEFLNKSKKVLEKLENTIELKKITVEKKIEKNLKGKQKFKSKGFKKKKFYRKNKSKRPR